MSMMSFVCATAWGGGGGGTLWSVKVDAPVVPKVSIQSVLELRSIERNKTLNVTHSQKSMG